MAVREGFEPSKPFDLHTFQACSLNHSDTSPRIPAIYTSACFNTRQLLPDQSNQTFVRQRVLSASKNTYIDSAPSDKI